MAINMLAQKLCREEEVGFLYLWGRFVGRADMDMRNWLHLCGKGQLYLRNKLSAAVVSGMDSTTI